MRQTEGEQFGTISTCNFTYDSPATWKWKSPRVLDDFNISRRNKKKKFHQANSGYSEGKLAGVIDWKKKRRKKKVYNRH